MAHIGDLRLDDLSLLRAGVEEELVDLVRADIAEDAAVLIGVPEPIRAVPVPPPASPCALDDLVRRDVDGLNDFADGALLDEFAGIDSGLHLEPLAIHDGVDALGLGDGLAHLSKLLQGGDAGLVGEEIFAMLHGAHAERGALIGDLRTEHELHRGIVQDLVLRCDDLHVGKALA